jgi:toxin ParE1/3/4
MRLLISPLAEQDLEQIADFIAQDQPLRALSFVQALHKQCKNIAMQPQIYRLRTELGSDIRSCAYGHYVIFFAAQEQELHIIRVLHGSRDIHAALNESQH